MYKYFKLKNKKIKILCFDWIYFVWYEYLAHLTIRVVVIRTQIIDKGHKHIDHRGEKVGTLNHFLPLQPQLEEVGWWMLFNTAIETTKTTKSPTPIAQTRTYQHSQQ